MHNTNTCTDAHLTYVRETHAHGTHDTHANAHMNVIDTHAKHTHTVSIHHSRCTHNIYIHTKHKIFKNTYLHLFRTHIKALTRRIRNYTSARTCMHAHTTYIHTAHTTYIHTAHTTYTHTAHNTIHNSYS